MTMVPLHLGGLHAYETVLLAALAFGPFLVLAVVVVVLRRRDIASEDDESRTASGAEVGDARLEGTDAGDTQG
jgi:hypothetical protein